MPAATASVEPFCRSRKTDQRGLSPIAPECLLQRNDGTRKLRKSTSLLYGVVWCCEKFGRYLIGLEQSFTLQTDHKPLVPLINSKDLSDTPIRCQRMLMRMARFNAEACYTQGKNMFVADTLSRSPIKHRPQDHIEEEVTAHVSAITSTWPASDAFLDRICKETEKDICLKTALEYTMTGWPEFREDVKLAARNLYAV